MYLSQLILNPRSRQVQREIAERYEFHRTLMSAFPERLSDTERVLFRLEIAEYYGVKRPCVLLQSQLLPDWHKTDKKNYFFDEPKVKEISPKFNQDQRLQFRLLANPTKKITISRGNSSRIGIYSHSEQNAWLDRKAKAGGFRVLSVARNERDFISGKKTKDETVHNMKFVPVQFDGILVVEDPDIFLTTLKAGIGTGKAFGFGLLSLGPASRLKD
ncbi:MAG: type I-E CRISPR-associated protein Cas6/Cse3/CasE [Anaerolineaceae bacterium]|jgi:CRISPR system Cascade subunit CasE|nr:type I-E CRISPR-associated protein Cas6/Cse3/CasE [Anaerolineaceae bacterium]MDY0280586.1 type I-E CRISPR-associated protein Cas6/Cse3/CasE [Salinivirgaceae bacterium]